MAKKSASPKTAYSGPRIVKEVIVKRGSRGKILDQLWGIHGGRVMLEDGALMIAFLSFFRANQLLRAYQIDRNPDHIFAAWCEYDDMGILPPETMFRNLRRAINERHKKPGKRPKETTLRDVQFLNRIVKDDSIPKKIDGKVIADLALQHKMTAANVRTAIARLRKLIKDPSGYEKSRAFRNK